MLPALALEVHRQADDELRRAYPRTLVDPFRIMLVECIQGGQSSGVFDAAANPWDVADCLIGAALYRLTVLHEELSEADLDAVLALVLDGLKAS